ncbi:MAG: pilus assembly protein N-terminal domain-containing protein [Treponema sp.]|nr:pilus assembly protein N-terminal domain-containing protein [Treponema sp.]
MLWKRDYYHEDDSTGYDKNELFRVSVSNGSVIKYTDKLSEKNNIMITGWNVGDSKLYIAGRSNGKAANYEINLNGTGTPKKVAEGQVFTCIGSLK